MFAIGDESSLNASCVGVPTGGVDRVLEYQFHGLAVRTVSRSGLSRPSATFCQQKLPVDSPIAGLSFKYRSIAWRDTNLVFPSGVI